MDLNTRIYGFLDDLGSYKATDKPSALSADIFNALLDAAREQAPDDPIVRALSPIGKNTVGQSKTDAGSMRAALEQLGAAVGGRPMPNIG